MSFTKQIESMQEMLYSDASRVLTISFTAYSIRTDWWTSNIVMYEYGISSQVILTVVRSYPFKPNFRETENEKTTPFFGTGYEQAQFIREKEARSKLGQVADQESIPSEERMENPEEFEGFENEDQSAEDRNHRRTSGRYSQEEVPEGKGRGG
jgi:hypothetical protein